MKPDCRTCNPACEPRGTEKVYPNRVISVLHFQGAGLRRVGDVVDAVGVLGGGFVCYLLKRAITFLHGTSCCRLSWPRRTATIGGYSGHLLVVLGRPAWLLPVAFRPDWEATETAQFVKEFV